jgi:Flp pilus assembly protein TadG
MKTQPRALTSSSGQSLVEFAMLLPFVLVIALGVVEVGWALLDSLVVTSLSREGSNLISRDTSLQDAGTALTSMSSLPVNFASGSSVIFSVVRMGATTGTANYNALVLYQRRQFGTFSGVATSRVNSAGGSFGGAPDYQAMNADNDTSLQVTGLPANLVVTPGGTIYITEIFTTHTWITPLNNFGIMVPQTLYSIAYF